MKVSLSVLFIVYTFCLNAQLAGTSRYYQEVNGNACNSIFATYDLGFLITGYLKNPNNKDLFIAKVNSNGDTVWTRTFDSGQSDEGFDVIQASTSKIMISGKRSVTALDASGNLLWSKKGEGNYRSIIETGDGGFIMAGDSGLGHGVMWKIDASGTTQWYRKFDLNNSNTVFYRVVQTLFDGGYAALGYAGGLVLMKIDGAGNFQWAKKITSSNSQSPNAEQPIDLHQDADLGFTVAGYYMGNNPNGYVTLLVKTDSLGSLVWGKEYSKFGRNLTAVRLLKAGGNTYDVFSTLDTATYSPSLHYMNVNFTGDTLQTKIYATNQSVLIHGVSRTAAGNLGMAGEYSNYSQSYLVTTDGFGHSCYESMQPVAIGSPTFSSASVSYTSSGAFSSSAVTYTSGLSFTENLLCTYVGMPGEHEEGSFSLFPNPCSGNFTLQVNEPDPSAELSIVNAIGEVIFSEKPDLQNGKNAFEFSQVLPDGIYLVRISGKNFRAAKKLLISRN